MDPATWLTREQHSAWSAILEFTGRVTEGLESDVAPFGLTGADYEVLVRLSDAGDDGLRMSELAARVLVSKSRLTYRIDRLQERGIVTRDVCLTDRRGFIARLTPAGRALLVEVAPRHLAGLRSRVIDRLDHEEFVVLGHIAAKVLGLPHGHPLGAAV